MPRNLRTWRLPDYCPVVADDLDGVRVGVEDAHPDGGGGEQDAYDAAAQVRGVGPLDPADLGVREVGVGGDEALQEQAQGHAQREGEDDGAQDQEVQRPPEVEAEPQGREEEDRGEQVIRHYGSAADRKSTRLNSSHANISYAVFCLK